MRPGPHSGWVQGYVNQRVFNGTVRPLRGLWPPNEES
jgi:hypothetical protein